MLRRKKLSEAWDGLPLRSELRAAIASNQADKSLEPVWLWMAKGTPHEFLGGTPLQGLDGLLLMPLPKNEDPPRDSIGAALGAIAQHLEKVPKREQIFTRLIERADRTYQTGPVLVCDLQWWAFYDSWQPWARECLTLLAPDRYGLRELIRETSAEYERGPRNGEAFAERVSTQVELTVGDYDPQAAVSLRRMRYGRLWLGIAPKLPASYQVPDVLQ